MATPEARRVGRTIARHNARPPADWESFDFESDTDLRALKALGLPVNKERAVLYTVNPTAAVELAGMWRGKHAFLICSGPSLHQLDLTRLSQPGITTMGVNNSWLAYRPQLWCGVDPAFKFIDTRWKDPGVLKFVPIERYSEHLHVKQPDGNFKKSAFMVRQMPAVFYYRRRDVFDHRTFLTWPSFSWGCDKKVVDSQGWSGCRSVMLVAIRMLHYLGFKHVYIIGADFNMVEQVPGREEVRNYAWKQFRQSSSVGSNNRTYNALQDRLSAMVPIFEEAGFYVWNATPGGKLEALPRISYDEAIEAATAECGKVVDPDGWYNHKLEKDGSTRFITK